MIRSRSGIEAGHLEVDPDQVVVVGGQRGVGGHAGLPAQILAALVGARPHLHWRHVLPRLDDWSSPPRWSPRSRSAPGCSRARCATSPLHRDEVPAAFRSSVDARRASNAPPTTRSPRRAWRTGRWSSAPPSCSAGRCSAASTRSTPRCATRSRRAPARSPTRSRWSSPSSSSAPCSTCRSSWYSTFRLEQRFGFNRMTWRLWLADTAKGIALGALIGLPLLAARALDHGRGGHRVVALGLGGVDGDHRRRAGHRADLHRAALQPLRGAERRAAARARRGADGSAPASPRRACS